MDEYHKIQTVYLRDPATKNKTLLDGQFATEAFEYLADNIWLFTEKIDGTNIRVGWDGERVTLGGRTDNAQIPAFLVQRLQELFPAEKMAAQFPDGAACLYGEGYGARIQKGGGDYIPDGVDFILFDVRVGEWWLRWGDVIDVALNLGTVAVPCFAEGTLAEAVGLARTGFPSHLSDRPAEGVVMRPLTDLFDRSGRRVIAKVKSKDFPDDA